ncbi:uncharacterized protein ISCGN_015017 [Ixodes scapularis]
MAPGAMAPGAILNAETTQSSVNLIVGHINERFGHLLADMNKHRWLTLAKLELCSQVIPMLLLCTEPGSSDSRKDRTIKADYGAFEGSSICGLSSHLEQRHVPELEETPFCKPSSTTALQAVPIRAKPDRTHASGFGTRRQDTMAKPCILFYQVIPMLLLCTEPGSSDSRKDRTIKADYGAFEGSSICGLSSHLEQRHVPELEETPFCKPSSTTALQAVPIRAKPDRTHASGFGTRRQDTMAKPCILFYQVIPMLLLCTEPGSSDSRKDRTIKADYGAFEGSSICGLSSHLEQRHVPELEETPFCKPSSTTALQAVPIRAKPDRTHAS